MKLSEIVTDEGPVKDTMRSKFRAVYPETLEDSYAEIDRLRLEVYRLNHFRLKAFEKAYNKRRYSDKKRAA